ncbi:hypothetical protein NC651_030879 [Populus alba x Populus x berolinensis]|nr:hypothetical protein NC651_030879 [Populus alba x Populus x berolinensis]
MLVLKMRKYSEQLISICVLGMVMKVVDIIASHPEHDIVIGIDTLGKKELLIHISSVLNIKIWVWPKHLQTIVETLEGLNTMLPTIGIMPSSLPWVLKPVKEDDNLFDSLNFSLQKRQPSDKLDGNLRYAKRDIRVIELVQPTNMKGIVFSSSCYVDPLYYFDHLCGVNQPLKRFVYKNERKEGGKKRSCCILF